MSADAAAVRVLCVARREPRWTALAAGSTEVCGGALRFTWVADSRSAVSALRETCFDAAIAGELADSWQASAAAVIEFVAAVQTLEATTPVIALVPVPDDALQAELAARDCDVCVSPGLWDSRALPGIVSRAIRRGQQRNELARLTAAHHRRLCREQADAASILQLQQGLLHSLAGGQAAAVTGWSDRYDELLKASILSGPQRLAHAVCELVDELAEAHQSPTDVLALHVSRVQALFAGVAGRTSQHLVSRADLLGLDVLTQLGERYRSTATV